MENHFPVGTLVRFRKEGYVDTFFGWPGHFIGSEVSGAQDFFSAFDAHDGRAECNGQLARGL